LAPHQLLEGKAEHYKNFLSRATNARLVAISDDFRFEIRSCETPTLVLRDVHTYGEVSNQAETGDAFFGLMLSHGPGCFSTSTPLPASPQLKAGQAAASPSLHWHWPNTLAVSHHRNSHVSYLRLESASLLRQLAIQGIRVDALHSLAGVPAPSSLGQLISAVRHRLITTSDINNRQQIVDAFLRDLALELKAMLGASGEAGVPGALHVAAAIAFMELDLGAAISLPQVAAELGLTPRAVQACFRNRLGVSPMRWLKLARLSQLRQWIHSPDRRHLSIQKMMGGCGLGNSTLNRQAYRQIYGITPAEDLLQAAGPQPDRLERLSNSHCLHFTCPDAAIEALQGLLERRPELTTDPAFSITLTIADSTSAGSIATTSTAAESTLSAPARPASSEASLAASPPGDQSLLA